MTPIPCRWPHYSLNTIEQILVSTVQLALYSLSPYPPRSVCCCWERGGGGYSHGTVTQGLVCSVSAWYIIYMEIAHPRNSRASLFLYHISWLILLNQYHSAWWSVVEWSRGTKSFWWRWPYGGWLFLLAVGHFGQQTAEISLLVLNTLVLVNEAYNVTVFYSSQLRDFRCLMPKFTNG